MTDYEFTPSEVWILEQFYRALDRARQCHELVDREGLMIDGRFGLRAHPAMAQERQYLLLASRLWRQLGVPVDPPMLSGDVVDLKRAR